MTEQINKEQNLLFTMIPILLKSIKNIKSFASPGSEAYMCVFDKFLQFNIYHVSN